MITGPYLLFANKYKRINVFFLVFFFFFFLKEIKLQR